MADRVGSPLTGIPDQTNRPGNFSLTAVGAATRVNDCDFSVDCRRVQTLFRDSPKVIAMLRIARWAMPAVVLGLVTVVHQPALTAADEPPSVEATSAHGAPEDVTDKVEVKLTSRVRGGKDGALVTGVIVRNTSDDDISGRLVVVVDETGVAGVTFGENDGALVSGESYVEVLPLAGTLKSGLRTTAKRIEFATAIDLTAEQRAELAPVFRVLRVDAQPETDDPLQTPLAAEENLPGRSYTQTRLNQVMRIQDRHTAELLSHEGVFGTATGENENGDPVILVYTQRHGIIGNLPGQYEGVALEQHVTGTVFRAGPAWAKADKPDPNQNANPLDPLAGTTTIPTDPTARFTRPVPIGVSMFNFNDACAAGTIGCRVVYPDGTLGILTNSHVGSREGLPTAIVEDLPNGIIGDQWTQPGCLEVGFDVPTDIIASLADFQPFSTVVNHIDAAVGRIHPPAAQLVDACTPADGYGFPSRTPVAPLPGMRVMKYGRTTGFRRAKIRGINANVTVRYTGGLVFFVNQISIYGDNIVFSSSGDSGSLIVTEQGHHPVGLLFAGGGFETLANPIQMVLDRFDVAVDDGTQTPPGPGPNGQTRTPGSKNSGRMGGAGGRIPIP